jgi:hypothetical protein
VGTVRIHDRRRYARVEARIPVRGKEAEVEHRKWLERVIDEDVLAEEVAVNDGR